MHLRHTDLAPLRGRGPRDIRRDCQPPVRCVSGQDPSAGAGVSVSERQPIFNAPGVIVAVLGALVAVLLAVDPAWGLLPDDTRAWLVVLLAFIPERLGEAADALPGGRLAAATQFVTHIFVHGDPIHLAINSAWLLAIGTPVARRLGAVRFLVFFLICGIGGALLFLPLNAAPMVGASGAISGIMGGALRFLFGPLTDGSPEPLASKAGRAELLSLRDTLTNRRILIGIAGWTLLNIVAALVAPTILDGRNIAWEAHLGGFFTGLLTFGLFDPGPPRSD
jgi:membrane associated rhomboid family serine protease